MNKKQKAILIAGHEIGGQMQLLAETMRKRCYNATSAAFNNSYLGYQNDIMFKNSGLRSRISRFAFSVWAIVHYDVFHFFWGVSLWSIWRFHLLDLPLLHILKKKIIVHFRGLDVVDINHFDYLREKALHNDIIEPPINRPDQQRKIRKWIKYADVVLISEPDLHYVVPNAILSPQVIDLNYWQTTREPLSIKDGIVRIVHAPSSRRKKGTEFIEKAVVELQKKGYKIKLILAEKLPYDKIKELYEISDIGVDQLLYGWHGKVSVELMALGKPVICNINPKYGKYKPDLPIVHADPKSIISVLEDLVCNEAKRLEIGNKSKGYVAKYHDVEIVTDQLLSLYGFSEKTLKKEKIEFAKTW